MGLDFLFFANLYLHNDHSQETKDNSKNVS